jgi:hypothetical protein
VQELSLGNDWSTAPLKVNEKVLFSYKEEKHHLFLDRITDNKVELSIYSTRVPVSLGVGEWAQADITGDKVNDIDVIYYGKEGQTAKVGLRLSKGSQVINQPTQEKAQETSTQSQEENQEQSEEAQESPQEQPSVQSKGFFSTYWLIILASIAGITILFVGAHEATKHMHHSLLKWKYFNIASKVRGKKVDISKELDSYKYKELKAYIQECLKWHYPKERIIKACVAVGWEKDIVEEAVKENKG